MLLLFLRAVVAAVYLLIGSILSMAASLRLTMLVFGSDYDIFAVGNIWEEARTRPLRDAINKTMPDTISAILTAGLGLAASFGLFAVVPLVP